MNNTSQDKISLSPSMLQFVTNSFKSLCCEDSDAMPGMFFDNPQKELLFGAHSEGDPLVEFKRQMIDGVLGVPFLAISGHPAGFLSTLAAGIESHKILKSINDLPPESFKIERDDYETSLAVSPAIIPALMCFNHGPLNIVSVDSKNIAKELLHGNPTALMPAGKGSPSRGGALSAKEDWGLLGERNFLLLLIILAKNTEENILLDIYDINEIKKADLLNHDAMIWSEKNGCYIRVPSWFKRNCFPMSDIYPAWVCPADASCFPTHRTNSDGEPILPITPNYWHAYVFSKDIIEGWETEFIGIHEKEIKRFIKENFNNGSQNIPTVNDIATIILFLSLRENLSAEINTKNGNTQECKSPEKWLKNGGDNIAKLLPKYKQFSKDVGDVAKEINENLKLKIKQT